MKLTLIIGDGGKLRNTTLKLGIHATTLSCLLVLEYDMAGQGRVKVFLQVGCLFCSQTPVPCVGSGYTLYAFLVSLHDFQLTFICMCHGCGQDCYEDNRYQ